MACLCKNQGVYRIDNRFKDKDIALSLKRLQLFMTAEKDIYNKGMTCS